MRVRKLSPQRNANGLIVTTGGDFTFGRGLADYYIDSPLGVAQNVQTRLRLFVGDFFLAQDQGTPWRTRVLGKYTAAVRDTAIRTRILSTPGVVSIASYGSSLDRTTRDFTVHASINTVYGPANVTLAIAEPK